MYLRAFSMSPHSRHSDTTVLERVRTRLAREVAELKEAVAALQQQQQQMPDRRPRRPWYRRMTVLETWGRPVVHSISRLWKKTRETDRWGCTPADSARQKNRVWSLTAGCIIRLCV